MIQERNRIVVLAEDDAYLSDDARAFKNASLPIPVVEDIYSIDAPRVSWFVVYTRANSEAKAKKGLDQKKLHSFLPTVIEWKPRTRAEAGRGVPLQEIERPLLSRYLFVKIPDENRAFRAVLSVDGVMDILGLGERKIPVPTDFVDFLRVKHEAGEFNKTERRGRVLAPKWAKEGVQVRITNGPFAGLLATVERCLTRYQITVALSFFGRDTAATLNLGDVSPVQGIDRPQNV